MSGLKQLLADNTEVENINASGYISGKKVGVFAALVAVEGSEPTVTATDADTYYPIPGTFANDPVEGFGAATAVTPGIKYIYDKEQYFEIDWHATISSDTSGTNLHCSVLKNGAIIGTSDKAKMGTRLKNADQPYNLSGTAVVKLKENDEIQLVVESSKAGAVLKFYHYTTTISEFFD